MAVSTVKNTPHIEKGKVTLSAIGATSFGTQWITFGTPFGDANYVTEVTISSTTDQFANCTTLSYSKTTTGCWVGVYNNGGQQVPSGLTIDWIAIGD